MTAQIQRVVALGLGVMGIALILAGCQYQPEQLAVGPGSMLAIPMFGNRTFRAGLEDVLTQEVRKQFLLGSRLEMVSVEDADLVLQGTVAYYQKEPVSQVADELAEYRVELHVRASLCDRRTGRQHWNRELTDSVTYAPVTGHTLQTEEEAIERVCQHLAVALVNLTTEGWER